jgi:hypothetical protein
MTFEQLEAYGRDFAAIVVFLLLVAGVLALFFVGFQKLLADKATSASAALSFGFLLVIMLTISEFKHVKGFGFDAETWDQKQIEAGKLVDQLQGLTEVASRELALFATKIGLWDNGPTNRDLMELIDELNPLMIKAGIDERKRNDFLIPIYRRISLNYMVDATTKLNQAINSQYKLGDATACRQPAGEVSVSTDVAQYRLKLCQLISQTYSELSSTGSFDVEKVISLAESGPTLDGKEELVKELRKIDVSAQSFANKSTLRPDSASPQAPVAQP